MSDNAPMTPEEAQQWADMADDVPGYHGQPASRAYRTIAGMSEESTYRAEDDNPDAFALRRHVRYVTEWRVDE